MKNTRKFKLLALLALTVALVMAFSACGAQGNTSAKSADGEWGENISWAYSADTKTLTISGKGDMKTIESTSDIPWSAAAISAEKIVVGDGITSISDLAFYGFKAAKTAELPEGLQSIGGKAFAFCASLEEIELPASLTAIGDSAFEWCSSLKSINVGTGLASLGERAFAYCVELEAAYLCSAELEIMAETFRACKSLTTLVLHPSITEDKVSSDAFDEGFSYSMASFEESATEEVTITVDYLESVGGEKVAPSQTRVVRRGDSYSITSPELDGYTVDLSVVEGIATAENKTYTVTYTLIPLPDDSETESTPDDTEPVTDTPADDSKGPNVFAIVILVLVVAAIGVGAFFLIRSEKREAEKQKNQNKAKNRQKK